MLVIRRKIRQEGGQGVFEERMHFYIKWAGKDALRSVT